MGKAKKEPDYDLHTRLNIQRAGYFKSALFHHSKVICEYIEDDEDIYAGNIIDLVADMMHFCAQRGFDFEDICFRAGVHFDREIQHALEENHG